MKSLLPLLLLALCGCRTPAPVAPLPAPTPFPVRPPAVPTAASLPPPRPVAALPDARSRQQAQLIEALINQNEALADRLAALQSAPAVTSAGPAPVAIEIQETPAAPAALPGTVATVPEPAIAPNAEGVIDLAAIEQAGSAGEPVNPFAVRAAAGDKTREVSLLVGGIILGKSPCAVMNERLVQAGDTIDGLTVERIEAGAVVVRAGAHRLRLPVSPAPTRVKLAL